ncbi:MAG: heterodisulfide reductase-related iron-sulfur binding cluster [Desulfosoma sp.]|uniref:heterodisulfide reductase-related iron-sulfur binding cluster n=1 Tax=Desulfosoma sp. TaxID=2603217 RepID=UPI004049597B
MTLKIKFRRPKEIKEGCTPETWARRELQEILRAIEADCTECGLCVKRCVFLQRYGTPKAIASSRHGGNIRGLVEAFECSLCGLCQAVCPFGVRPSELFLELRREAVLRGVANLPEHRGLLAYERKGTSRRYSLYAIPDGCTTVFFPGCTFAGTRSEAVLAIQEHVHRIIPNLGVVLDCCTKPSHDLGRHAYFLAMFGEMKNYLMAQGVSTVLVACPNCYKVFRRYGAPLQVRTIYEVFAEDRALPQVHLKGTVTIHDPCVMRDEAAVQKAVRTLVDTAGLEVEEMPGSRQRTLCCGEGGGVGSVAPELARQWRVERREQAGKRPVVTYCAGCVGQLRRTMNAIHIMDLLLDGDAALAGRARVSRSPFTYWKRLRLKETLRRRYTGAHLRERTDQGEAPKSGFSWWKSLLLAAVLTVAVFGLHAVELSRYLERDILEAWIESYGALAPLIYMLV